MKPCCKAKRQMTASMLPEALVVCPVKALVDEMWGRLSPKTRRSAALSVTSLLGVAVPCALT